MTIRLLTLLAMALMIAATAVEIHAQGRRGGGQRGGGQQQRGGGFFGRGGGGGASELLMRSDVQKELDLSDDQVSDIQGLAEEARNAFRGGGGIDFRALRDMSEEERQEAFQEMRSKMEEAAKERNEKVMELLSSSQKTRLEEISFQRALSQGAFERAAELAGVELSDDQKEELNEQRAEVMAKLNEKIAELRREANVELLSSIMSEKQIERASGEAFTFEQNERGGFFGRGGGRDRGERGERGGRARGEDRPERPERPAGDDNEDGGTRRRRR